MYTRKLQRENLGGELSGARNFLRAVVAIFAACLYVQ
jgi:hypothetical protein